MPRKIKAVRHDHLVHINPRKRQGVKSVAPSLPRPLAKGSAFSYDATGCIKDFAKVFKAFIGGHLSEAEMREVEEHQSGCLKCHNTLAAHLSDYESETTSDENDESSDKPSEGESEDEPEFGAGPVEQRPAQPVARTSPSEGYCLLDDSHTLHQPLCRCHPSCN